MNIKYFLTLAVCFLFLNSCSQQMVFPSVEFDSCFMNHNSTADLNTQLTQLSKSIDLENPNAPVMAVVGCLHYQLNHPKKAEQWLKRSYSTAKESDNAKSTAAAALGLIYLKQQAHQKIVPYIMSAKKNHLGRWMLVLYYIDYYRKYDNTEYLNSAMKYMHEKHRQEGETPATKRMLAQMSLIYSMDQICKNNPNDLNCRADDLDEEKRYLFSTALGFLSMLIKTKPFNNL